MKHYESLIIGHITMDHDTDYLGNETLAIGGAVIYSSASAYALGHKVAALTKINPDDSERLTYLRFRKKIYIASCPSRHALWIISILRPTRNAESVCA